MSFAAALGAGPPPDFSKGLQYISMARGVCRDPDPGAVGPTLERIDELLSSAEQLLSAGGESTRAAFGLVMASGVIAATEPLAVLAS